MTDIDNNRFYVYVHRRKTDNTIFYVGKGQGRRAYKASCRNPYWSSIVLKYGFNAEIIHTNLNEKDALRIEVETINEYKKAGFKLSNLTDGGEGISGYKHTKPVHNKGVPCSEEMKKQISSTLKEKGFLPPIGWNKGKKTPIEVLEKRSIAMKANWALGNRAPVSLETKAKQSAVRKGKKLSAETCLKMSIAGKNNKYIRKHPDMTGFKHSEESKRKMSEGMKGRKSHFAKKVKCIDTGLTFESAHAAAYSLGRNNHSLVSLCCRGGVEKAYGMRFEYL